MSPDWIPPQYTVQFCGLDWVTMSSNLRCFEPSEKQESDQLRQNKKKKQQKKTTKNSEMNRKSGKLAVSQHAYVLLIPMKSWAGVLAIKTYCPESFWELGVYVLPSWSWSGVLEATGRPFYWWHSQRPAQKPFQGWVEPVYYTTPHTALISYPKLILCTARISKDKRELRWM